MKKLSKIRLVQYFLYDTLDIDIGMSCGIFGANGSGKSSLLDAVQTVMLRRTSEAAATPASPSTRRPTKATTTAAASAPIASANTATPPKRAYATAPTPTSP